MDNYNSLDQLQQLRGELATGEPGVREKMLIAAQQLVSQLETPSEFISRLYWAEPALSACVRTAVDLKLFEALAKKKDEPQTASDLAKITGADEGLLERLLRHLAALNVVEEPKLGGYLANSLSTSLTEPKYRDGIIYCSDVAGPSFRSVPEFLKQTSYKQPLNPVAGPFQHAHKTKLHFFPWLGENVQYFAAFANYMMGYRQGKMSWMDKGFFPVDQKLSQQSLDSEEITLVDVGGGKGHDLMELITKFPALSGKVVLQDKPEVIEEAKAGLAAGINAQGHDFFTEQTVKGASAYYLHSVLHDWDDESCLSILRALKPAMIPGKSMLLINDLIVPDRGAAWSVTSMDWLMMVLGSVRERTESDFRKLLTGAGFRVEKVWSVEQGTESLIEAYVDV